MAKSKKVASAIEGPNALFWKQLCDTPAEYLKDFKRSGGFQGTSVDPVYRIRRLTEIFGPCGMGWGFVQEDQWSDGGSGAYVVYVRGHLWYMHDGQKYQTMSHTGGTVCDRAPDEAYKMAETDALGKCCLDLGMAADVYLGLGRHEGDKYQDTRDQQYSHQPEAAGRRPAGTNPSNAKADTQAPVTAIGDQEFAGIVDEIQALTDDVSAYDYSRKLFNRMLLSVELGPNALKSLSEKLLTKRASFVTEEILPNLKKTAAAYIKQGWMTKETAAKIIALCERKLGIAPQVKE